MFSTNYLLFSILLLLGLGAVIAFSLLVVKPLQTRWAMAKARKMVASQVLEGAWTFNNVYRMLATTRNDLEAAMLWRKLNEMKERGQ